MPLIVSGFITDLSYDYIYDKFNFTIKLNVNITQYYEYNGVSITDIVMGTFVV